MREVLIVFFIVVIVIMAMAFPFKTRILTHINFLKTKGYYNLKVMRIKLLTGRFFIDESDGFMIENSVDILSENYNKPFVKSLIKELLARLDVKKVEAYYTGGFKEDSYLSALIGGAVSSVLKTVYSYFSERYENVKLYEDVDVTFFYNNLEFTFDIVVSISLFEILKSIIKANKQIKIKEQKWKKWIKIIELKNLWMVQ